MFKQLLNTLKENVAAALPVARLTNAALDEALLTVEGQALKARHFRGYIVALIKKGELSEYASPKKSLEIWKALAASFEQAPTETLAALTLIDESIQEFLSQNFSLRQYYLGNNFRNALLMQAAISQLDMGSSRTSGGHNLSNQQIIDGCMPMTDYDY